MRRSHHSFPATRTRRRLAAGALAGSMLLAACGGGSDNDASDSSDVPADETLPEVSVETDADAATDTGDEVPAEVVAPSAVGGGFVDLVGSEVVAASELESNRLPSVVVDDLTNDRKVNFRNLVPQDKPVLLWMWAPH